MEQPIEKMLYRLAYPQTFDGPELSHTDWYEKEAIDFEIGKLIRMWSGQKQHPVGYKYGPNPEFWSYVKIERKLVVHIESAVESVTWRRDAEGKIILEEDKK